MAENEKHEKQEDHDNWAALTPEQRSEFEDAAPGLPGDTGLTAQQIFARWRDGGIDSPLLLHLYSMGRALKAARRGESPRGA